MIPLEIVEYLRNNLQEFRIPRQGSRKVLQFCSEINGNQPFCVPISPAEHSIKSECFPNVNDQVKQYGGELIHGWSIVEHPKIMLEVEFHAVWKTPEAVFIDITPPLKDYLDKTLFLPEDNLKYDLNNPDKIVCNKWFSLTKHQSIEILFDTLRKIYELRDKYPHGISLWSEEDTKMLYELEKIKAKCFVDIIKFENRSKRRNKVKKK